MDVVTDAVTRSRPGQVRLSTIEKPGQVIAADFIMTAGTESTFWISGFDDDHSAMSPGQVNVLLCIKDAMERGQEVFDLGPGTESYKVRITKDAALLQGFIFVRRGLRPLHSPARLVPYQTRKRAAQMLGRLRARRSHDNSTISVSPKHGSHHAVSIPGARLTGWDIAFSP